MNAYLPVRIKVGLTLVFLFVLLSGLPQVLSKGLEWSRTPPADAITVRSQRFTELRKVLPERGTIGYLADGPLDRPLGDGTVESVFDIAQYCLAPLILVHSTQPDLIVGDFSTPEAGAQIVSAQHLVVIRQFQNGVYLLRKGGM